MSSKLIATIPFTLKQKPIDQIKEIVANLIKSNGEKLSFKIDEKFRETNGRLVSKKLSYSNDSAIFTALDCAATLKDKTVLDPCVIIPSKVNPEYLLGFEKFVAAGSITSISESKFLLPRKIRAAAHEVFHGDRGEVNQVLISFNGNLAYVVNPGTVFYENGEFKGSQADPEKFLKIGPDFEKAPSGMRYSGESIKPIAILASTY